MVLISDCLTLSLKGEGNALGDARFPPSPLGEKVGMGGNQTFETACEVPKHHGWTIMEALSDLAE